MKELIPHIEYLLTLQDCVILPGFGGFVLRYQEANICNDGKITPPCKVVGFNAALTHNDGLLASSLMQERGLSFAEAMILIESAVREFQIRIQQGLIEDMGSLGTFGKGAENEPVFIPAVSNQFDLDVFGLPSIVFSPLKNAVVPQPEVHVEEVKSDVVMIPVNMKVLKRVSAIAAIIIGMLFVSHPLEQENIPENYASIISSELLNKAVIPGFSYYQHLTSESSVIQEEGNNLITELELIASEETETSTEEIVNADNQPLESVSVVAAAQSPQPQKLYYIIIGSFPSKAQAEKRIDYLAKKGLSDIKYLHVDNKYRLYVNNFSDKTSANQYLDSFRADNPGFSDAWLLAHITD